MRRKRRKRKEKLGTCRPPDRATNPVIPWMHGLAAIADQRWDEAIIAFHRYLEMDTKPEDRSEAYQNLSMCYLELGHYDKALAALDEVERHTPNDPDALHSRGVVYAQAGRVLDAITTFERFIRCWPKLADRLEAQEAVHQLRRIHKGEIPAGAYLLEYLQEQVSTDVELGDFDLVERKARRMIAADPNRPEGHFALGVACLEQDRYREALEALLAAHAREPDYPPTLYNIGYAYQKLGEPEQAIPWLERVLQQEPEHSSALYHLGLACERMGRRDEAVNWWRRTLRIDPNHHPTQQGLYEAGLGPEPAEPPLSPTNLQLRRLTPIVKARMRRPEVYHNEGVTLTFDGGVGFVLEDAQNPLNATIHAGGPFRVSPITNQEDLMDLMGVIKLLLRMANAENSRDIAILIYYDERPTFSYQARFNRGELTEFDAQGQFVITEVPRLFKLRIDSDLSTPYGDPMQGKLIYLNQKARPGVLVSTLGLESEW